MLKSVFLQNFRSYQKQEFSFENTTLIVGPNTSGKTNLIEAINLLSSGKSFRTDKDTQMLKYGEDVGHVKGVLEEETELEVVLTNGEGYSRYKKFLVNGVPKRLIDFSANFPCVIFSPQDLDIIIDSPGLRRNFLDEVLEQTSRNYKIANISYSKALRQRNALLELAREGGQALPAGRQEFEYWDKLVIENGSLVTEKRQEFIDFANSSGKEVFDFAIFYDKSIVSPERLLQYQEQEVRAGVTLVGPHRDDFSVLMFDKGKTTHDIKYFGSRGQQRLAILQFKLLELLYIEEALGKRPVLILDDIFSELDEGHINLVFEQIGKQQTIITTTHKEFIPKKLLNRMKVISF